MVLQRYVSKELTHFVGKGLSGEEQYSILVNNIIQSGWLKTAYDVAQPEESVVEAVEAGVLGWSMDPSSPAGEMYRPRAVSFCDIPEGDLEIHMRKYSPFGLSFGLDTVR